MAMNLDSWREYFQGANADIFDIIEHAIMVAAIDFPDEFKLRKERVAEMLFTCKVTKCIGCDKFELAVPKNQNECKSGGEFNSSEDDNNPIKMEENVNNVSKYSYKEAEALTNELEEESQLIGEVVRIKEILDNHRERSVSTLFESLRRLQLMDISVVILKATDIGKSVNALKQHRAQQIRDLVQTLLQAWMTMVDEWVSTTNDIAGAEDPSKSTRKPSVEYVEEEEEGLPSPPLDEGYIFGTQTTSMEFSQFFDDIDEDGNVRYNENCKVRNNGRKPPAGSPSVPRRKPLVKSETVVNKPFSGSSGTGRPTEPAVQPKLNYKMEFQQKSDKGTIQKKPSAPQQDVRKNGKQQVKCGTMLEKPSAPPQDKLKCSNDAPIEVKLEAAKRKLQERYEEVENAKKHRTVQVMELHEIPKQRYRRTPPIKTGDHIRNLANGRR